MNQKELPPSNSTPPMNKKDFARSLAALGESWKKTLSSIHHEKKEVIPIILKEEFEQKVDIKSNLEISNNNPKEEIPLINHIINEKEINEENSLKESKKESDFDFLSDPLESILQENVNENDVVLEKAKNLVFSLPQTLSIDEPAIEDKLDLDLWSVFMEEADEYMPSIRHDFQKLETGDLLVLSNLYRSLHTMKGTVGQFGALRARGLFHAIESMIEEIKATPNIDSILERLPVMQDILDASFILIEGLREKKSIFIPNLSDKAIEFLPAALQQTIRVEKQKSAVSENNQSTDSEVNLIKNQEEPDQVVRVKASVVDHLLNQSNEMKLARAGLKNGLQEILYLMKDLNENGQRLSHLLREIEIHADSQIQARRLEMEAGLDTFDPLEFDRFTRLQEISRFMAEGLNDVNQIQQSLQRVTSEQETRLTQQDRALEEIQQGLSKTRLTSIEKVISERLSVVVRQTSRELDKAADFDIQGGRLEVDRVMLESLVSPLSHILRNSLAHGIESEEKRLSKNKPAKGHLSIYFKLEGGRLKVVCQDDGAGLNLKIIKDKAVEKGLWDSNSPMSVQQAADMICAPAFSTAEAVSELAGRGVGMDVVRTSILDMGGRFSIDSIEGQGMTVTIIIPTSLSNILSLVVSAADQRWSLPAETVAKVQVLRGDELIQARKDRKWVDTDGISWSFEPLAEKLGLKEGFDESKKHAFVVAIQEKDQRMAFEVDRMRSVQELPLRPLGRSWSRLPGLLGATLMPDGEAVFLIDLIRLPKILKEKRSSHLSHLSQQLHVLVVDDSLAVRRYCERILTKYGYKSTLVKDGREALDFLNQPGKKVDAAVLDVEMPRMDGFELTRQIRADSKLKHLPLIMVTSRTAEKHQNHGLELGVNDYLGKPVKDDELIAALKKWI